MSERLSTLEQQNKETEEKTNILIDETADLKTGFNFNVVDSDKSHNGLGAAASKVYYSKSPLSIGGYGEMYYAAPDNGDNFADIYRFVPYIGYRFSDNIILNVELEIEHGSTDGGTVGSDDKVSGGGKFVVEFMYLDFLIDPAFNLQVGHLLVPMGLTNLRHEPTLFNTVQRPETERQIIPSTWHENGIMAYGTLGESGLSYNLGFVNAIDYTVNSPATTTTRDGRIGSERDGTMNRVAGVGRLDYEGLAGLLVGGSLYYGDAAQGKVSGASAFTYELHGVYENSGFKFKGLYAETNVNGLNENGAYPEALKKASGYYVNAEYDLLNQMNSEYRLPLFVQYDTHNKKQTLASAADPEAKESVTTVGLNFFPHEQVVLKLDYAMKAYEKQTETIKDFNTLSVSLGFIF
ncbi:MAG: porin [Campylobacterales bacterium]|nr:porin [Campylobacterales bacterium]